MATILLGRYHGSYPNKYYTFKIPNGVSLIMSCNNANVPFTSRCIIGRYTPVYIPNKVINSENNYVDLVKYIVHQSTFDQIPMCLIKSGVDIPDFYLEIKHKDKEQKNPYGLFALPKSEINPENHNLTFEHLKNLTDKDMIDSGIGSNYIMLSTLIQNIMEVYNGQKIILVINACIGNFFSSILSDKYIPNHMKSVINKEPLNQVTKNTDIIPSISINISESINVYQLLDELPIEPKPIEPKPIKPKPIEPKSIEPKPIETKSGLERQQQQPLKKQSELRSLKKLKTFQSGEQPVIRSQSRTDFRNAYKYYKQKYIILKSLCHQLFN